MMNEIDPFEMIANGENSGVEFERDDALPEQLAKAVVAFANFRGGRILLGVEDDGSISGVQRDDLEHWVMNTVFERHVHPMIIPFYKEMQIDEQRRIAVIRVSQGATKPYVVRDHDQEDAYIRIGSTSRLATQEQQDQLYGLAGILHTEQLPVSGSGLVDLDRERLKDYLTSIMGAKETPADDKAWHERLCERGFMTESEGELPVCTIAGLVLFGHTPRRLLPQAGARWTAFEPQDKTGEPIDDQILDGPLVSLRKPSPDGGNEIGENGLIDNLIEAMRPFISKETNEVTPSMPQERSWLYPMEAIQESIVNALSHRNWTRYEKVEVACYADRLEVSSPGALHNPMTVERMIKGERSPRNSLIVNVLQDYGYTDVHSMGVLGKIIHPISEHNGTKPDFKATEDRFKVVMHKGQPRSDIRE